MTSSPAQDTDDTADAAQVAPNLQSLPGNVQSIARAFTVLETVASADRAIGVTEIGQSAGIPAGTVYRMASTLTDLGYLNKDPRSKYSIGGRVMLLTRASDSALVSLATPYLNELAEQFEETVAMGTLQSDAIVYLAQAAGRRTIRAFTAIGERISPHCQAIGKLLLSDLDDDSVRSLLSRLDMRPYTANTITDPDAFITELELIRERGYALNEGEREEGMRCLSVPIPFDGIQLGYSLSAPSARMSDAVVADYLPVLRKSAEALAAELHQITIAR